MCGQARAALSHRGTWWSGCFSWDGKFPLIISRPVANLGSPGSYVPAPYPPPQEPNYWGPGGVSAGLGFRERAGSAGPQETPRGWPLAQRPVSTVPHGMSNFPLVSSQRWKNADSMFPVARLYFSQVPAISKRGSLCCGAWGAARPAPPPGASPPHVGGLAPQPRAAPASARACGLQQRLPRAGRDASTRTGPVSSCRHRPASGHSSWRVTGSRRRPAPSPGGHSERRSPRAPRRG